MAACVRRLSHTCKSHHTVVQTGYWKGAKDLRDLQMGICKPGPSFEGMDCKVLRNSLDMAKSSSKLTCPELGGALVMGQGS